jgi:hypothetical protein
MQEQEKTGKIRDAAYNYYRRRDIQKNLMKFAQNREVVPLYLDNFGKRPDTLQYESDVYALAEKGATSFHCSEELWHDALQLSTEMSQEELNKLRVGWDLIIDIDTKYLDYGRIAAELLIEALKFHNVHSFGIKYSGSRGFHIGIPYKAFPEKIGSIETKDFFPEGARAITQYLYDLIKDKLLERISELSGIKVEGARGGYAKDIEGAKKVMPDLVLVSPRHLFRMPYSLHEKTCLASIVIKPEQLKNFKPSWAKPELVMPKQFLPEPEKNEARELLLQAIDWQARHKEGEERKKFEEGKEKTQYKEIVIKDLTPALYPPCISNILAGMKDDGRKRALFILLNFFKSLKMKDDEIVKKIEEWNKKNYKPLRDGYIRSQISWFKKQKAILPPNCDKPIYKEIGVCMPAEMCKLIKNPVNFTTRKARLQEYGQRTKSMKGRRSKRKNE